MISDPFTYASADPPAPVPWPPAACVDAIHWWGRTADKLVLARPVWCAGGGRFGILFCAAEVCLWRAHDGPLRPTSDIATRPRRTHPPSLLRFKVGIWLEIVVQAPCYALLLAGFSRSRRWVRLPSLIYATVLLTIMPIVMAEQVLGAGGRRGSIARPPSNTPSPT